MQTWIVVAGTAAVIAAASACQSVSGSKESRLTGALPECPHDWPRIFGGPASEKGEKAPTLPPEVTAGPLTWVTAGTSDESSVARSRTNVPEFHDCQRMRVEGAGAAPAYGALAAVFAADSLERITDDSITGPRVIGEVLSDGAYDQLKFEKNFNCLVVAHDNTGLKAWMVPVGVEEQRCKSVASLTWGARNLLRVRVLPNTHPKASIPPVARWDWDDATHVQFIGIRCGDQWCEIGPDAEFGQSPSYGGEATTALKGYYDEQRLGVSGSPLAPGASIATVVPAAKLDQASVTAFNGGWTEVAQVWTATVAAPYDKKYNFTVGGPPGSTRPHATLEICRGSWWQCPGVYFAPLACTPDPYVPSASLWSRFWQPKIFTKITSPSTTGTTSKYFCVVRRTGMPNPPAVARWRWRASDETIWIRCANGCCEVDATFF